MGVSPLIRTLGVALSIISLLALSDAALAQATVPCGPFTPDRIASPEPREAAPAVQRFDAIKYAVGTEPYRALFLGDSLTERFDLHVWQQHMAPRGVLNSGVNGDRTEHLLWRLKHGNLAGPRPAGLVVLIGTNDLTNGGSGRTPELAAEGIRANLLYLRQQLPNAPILLLLLLPRIAAPDAGLRRKTVAVKQLIASCGDNRTIVYADIGGVLLDPQGRLTPAIAPDQLHFSRAGYELLAPRLDALIDGILPRR
jgi:lysophospholipase L1-like esterase